MGSSQRPSPRGSPDPHNPATRAAQVHRDLRNQSRRILHDSGGCHQAANRSTMRCASDDGRMSAEHLSGDLPTVAAPRYTHADALAQRRATARAGARGYPVNAGVGSRRNPSVAGTGSTKPCSRYLRCWPSTAAIRFRTFRTFLPRLRSSWRTTHDGIELHFARVKIPPELPRFIPLTPHARRATLHFA